MRGVIEHVVVVVAIVAEDINHPPTQEDFDSRCCHRACHGYCDQFYVAHPHTQKLPL